MSEKRPPKPDPDCVWDKKARVWRWPDDRSDDQRKADDLAAELAESGDWNEHGFKRTHSARVDAGSDSQ